MSKQARQAINFLRGRQEYSDLRYWLSLVNYDPEERSFSNQIYLVYLIIFFTFWFFIVLVYAATSLLNFIPLLGSIPADTLLAALLLISFLLFTLNTLYSSSIRSPLIFTDEQRYLLCQQPFPPRSLVFRWIVSPWLQNLLLFVLICLMLGFTFSEITFPPDEISRYFFVYVWYGLRVVFLTAPFHLSAFISSWAAGIYALNRRGKLSAYFPSVIFASILILAVVSFIAPAFFGVSLPLLRFVESILSNILFSFFGTGNFSFAITLSIGFGLVIIAVALLWLVSGNFSSSKAASETEAAALIAAYSKYGQLDAIKALKKKNRLGLAGRSLFSPSWQNEKAFNWKAALMTRRNFGFDDFWNYLVSFLLMFSFSFAGNTPIAWLGLASWFWLLSRTSTDLFKQDLSLWQITRQVPVPIKKWGAIDLLLPSLPHMTAVLLGLCAGMLLFKTGSWQFIPVLLMGLTSAQLQLGQDLLRKNQVELVAAGSVQGFGLRGLLMGILCLVLPLVALLIEVEIYNLVLGTLTALLLTWISWRGFQRQVERFSAESKVSLFRI